MYRSLKLSTLSLVAAATLACGGIGTGGYPAPEPRDEPRGDTTYDREVVGEVVEVDARREEITIDAERGGTRLVRYEDRETQVLYQGRRYAVANLEPGDYVRIQVATDRSGNLMAREIQVVESRQERYGERGPADHPWEDDEARGDLPPGDNERLAGTVESVDQRRGVFELRLRRGETVTVEMPYRPEARDRDAFADLDVNDWARILAEPLGGDRYQLVEFEEVE